MALTAGQLRAPVLRDALFTTGYLNSDAAVYGNEVLTEASGLAVGLEPSSKYAIDGYIAFDTAAAPGIRIGLDAPTGATGHWGLLGVTDISLVGNIGTATAYRAPGYGLAYPIFLTGPTSGGSACLVHGYVTTVPGGALKLLFAQFASTATRTAITAGSWLRLSKIA